MNLKQFLAKETPLRWCCYPIPGEGRVWREITVAGCKMHQGQQDPECEGCSYYEPGNIPTTETEKAKKKQKVPAMVSNETMSFL